mmetsp:Transcript_133608/g.266577  ORF Transcript_133608/g.266577 Transcript_133608/m.266577 type:complete len:121 (-) Transcript_133608:494-856(-)
MPSVLPCRCLLSFTAADAFAHAHGIQECVLMPSVATASSKRLLSRGLQHSIDACHELLPELHGTISHCYDSVVHAGLDMWTSGACSFDESHYMFMGRFLIFKCLCGPLAIFVLRLERNIR